MSVGVNFRQRGFGSVGPIDPALILEYSQLIDAGMCFKWDASGPAAAMQQVPLTSTPPEFAYLALDAQPVQLFIKRTRPGVLPAVWDAGPQMPNFTLQQFLDSEAAATQSAQASAASATQSAQQAAASAVSAGSSGQFASQSQQAQVAAKASANSAAFYAAQAVGAVGINANQLTPAALVVLLQGIMAILPTQPPAGSGQPWNDGGILSFTP